MGGRPRLAVGAVAGLAQAKYGLLLGGPVGAAACLSVPESDDRKRALRDALAERAQESDRGRWDVLDAVDFVCRTVEDLWIPAEWAGKVPIPDSEPLARLDYILSAGGSAYRYRGGHLERRVDATTVAAFERVVASATDEASMLLRRA